MYRNAVTTSLAAALLLALAPALASAQSQLAAGAGLTAAEASGMTLTEIYIAKFNRESGRDQQQVVAARSDPVTVETRRHAQLIRSAGLTPEEAEGLSLAEIAAIKASRNARNDERVVVMIGRSMPATDRAAYGQLVAGAGMTPFEASGLSLNDLYVMKINREARRDERQSNF
jgi:hypothetical protein